MSTATKKAKKKKKMSPVKRNLFWDLGITLGFLVVFNQEITGETLHEWLALALFAGLIVHFVFHWKWVVSISKRIFDRKLKRKVRLSYAAVVGTGLSFILMGVSGLLISEAVLPTLGLNVGSDRFEDLHELASSLTLFFVGVHLFQHRKWIMTNGRKYLFGWLPKAKPKPAR